MSTSLGVADVRFTSHAVERYIERVRPGSDLSSATRDLAAMVYVMTFAPTPPPWLDGRLRRDGDAYLILGDVAFVLRTSTSSQPWSAVTCMARGTISEATRQRRSRRRA